MVDGELQAPDEIVADVDFEMFSNLLWVFAKKADKSIQAPDEWEDNFTSIPLRTVLPEVMDLLTILLDGQQAGKKNLAQVTQ